MSADDTLEATCLLCKRTKAQGHAPDCKARDDTLEALVREAMDIADDYDDARNEVPAASAGIEKAQEVHDEFLDRWEKFLAPLVARAEQFKREKHGVGQVDGCDDCTSLGHSCETHCLCVYCVLKKTGAKLEQAERALELSNTHSEAAQLRDRLAAVLKDVGVVHGNHAASLDGPLPYSLEEEDVAWSSLRGHLDATEGEPDADTDR